MARKPHDNSCDIKALADRRKTLIAQRKTRLGELLQLNNADRVLDFDQIAGLVSDGLERMAKDPSLGEVWRRKGQECFRTGRAGVRNSDGKVNAHDQGGADRKGRSSRPHRAPAPARGVAPSSAGQLLLDPKI